MDLIPRKVAQDIQALHFTAAAQILADGFCCGLGNGKPAWSRAIRFILTCRDGEACRLPPTYVRDKIPVTRQQLAKAGVRLAMAAQYVTEVISPPLG